MLQGQPNCCKASRIAVPEEQSWLDAFDRGLYYLKLAAANDQILGHCYLEIYPDCRDHMIFLEETSRSSLL